MIHWDHLIEAFAATIPLWLFIWDNKRRAKADNEKRQEKIQEVVNSLVTERKFYPSHGHDEKGDKTPLTVEGISYVPKNGGNIT